MRDHDTADVIVLAFIWFAIAVVAVLVFGGQFR